MITAPRRVLGLRDVVLFLVVAVVGTRWIAVAAAVGPAALTLWLIALLAMFVPLGFAVMELSSRWPDEGGLYVWTRRAFGDFAGFMAAWMYWASCLVYFPGLLYFVASNALFVAGPRGAALADSAAWHMGAALVGLALALLPNLLGVNLGKHLHNAGAFGSWLPVALLGVMAAVCATRFGPATEISAATLAPVAGARDLALWSALAFAFGGLETSSLMAGEIVDPRRTLPRAILIGGLLITAIYVGGTLAVLIAIPASEASGLQGLMQAIERASSRLGWGWVAPVAAGLLTLGGIGMAGAWLAATARLPFVAGVDRALPAAFGRLHPRWGTPHIALLVQAAAAAVFAVLGQAGESVQGAYDVLVSMCVVTYFIPFLFLFAALIRVQREPAGAEVMRVPGGAPLAVALGLLGLATTLGGIALAVVPPAGTAHPAIAVLKVVGSNAALLVVGALLFRGARARGVRPS